MDQKSVFIVIKHVSMTRKTEIKGQRNKNRPNMLESKVGVNY